MTTTVSHAEKFLVYDGDCPMCRSTVAWLTRLRLVDPAQLRSNHVLEGADLETVRRAGIRNQLVVLDPETRETRAGTDGLLWIIGENTGNHFLVRLLGLPGLRHLLRWGYETISYNRRVISPPRSRIVCDCEPEVTLARRMMLVVPALVLAFVILALFGAAVFHGFNMGGMSDGALLMAAAVGCGWLVMSAAGLVLLRGEQRIDYLAHLTMTLLAGSLVLVPGGLLVELVPRAGLVVIAVSALVSFALMLSMQRRRVAAVGLSLRWLWAWSVAVALGAVAVAFLYASRMSA